MSALFLNPPNEGVPPWGAIVAIVAFTGLVVGFFWIRRISGGDEDPDRSFWRYQGQRGGGSSIPSTPDLPAWRWLFTRGAVVFGIGAVAFAIAGPLVLRRWEGVLEGGPPAVLVWLIGVAAAVVGTVWIIRIARRSPEDGAPPWRYRD